MLSAIQLHSVDHGCWFLRVRGRTPFLVHGHPARHKHIPLIIAHHKDGYWNTYQQRYKRSNKTQRNTIQHQQQQEMCHKDWKGYSQSGQRQSKRYGMCDEYGNDWKCIGYPRRDKYSRIWPLNSCCQFQHQKYHGDFMQNELNHCELRWPIDIISILYFRYIVHLIHTVISCTPSKTKTHYI